MRKTFTFLIALMALCVSSWATNTVITWDASDLATVHVEMGYNSMGQSQTIKGITVTNNTDYAAGDYCHFQFDDDPQAQYCGFSMRDDGQLVFAPESGTLTSIVIHCDMYPGDMTPLATGWTFDGENQQLTWTGNAASVVLHGDNSSNSFTSGGPISSIEFTVSGFIPTTAVTWEVSDLASINVGNENGAAIQDVNLSQTVKNITVAAEAPAPVGEAWNTSFMNGDVEYGGNINIGSAATLIFTAPENYNLKRIVITGNGCNSGYSLGGSENLTSDWSWDENNCKLTWSGEAASSVELACTDQVNGMINFSLIESIVFTLAEAGPAPDTREVPELKFYDNLTEATIIHDYFGWDFEPGTTYNPRYGYTISIKDGVYYYQDQPYDYWKAPSELEEPLPITYSLSNNDVIELTQAEGDEFSFNVLGLGDVVVTASAAGNTRFQPASATFTIHVIDGQAPTKECVLKWVSGPNAGQLVPADFEFNLQTGDEVEWESMQLYEKDYPAYVYAPSTAIWGSRDYHVACLNGELKLRALMAGDDVFTVKYSRYHYPEGFDNGNFRTIEIPVHIKPSQPALVSNVDFGSSPLEDPNVLFNTENYDPTSHEAKLAGTLTTAAVKNVMGLYNYNSQGWKDNLPQTISFELAAGKGSFEVNCSVQPGYEVRIIKGGDTQANDIITSTTPQPYVVNYDVAAQTPVVIFVAEAGSSNPAPKRAPAAKQDADPLASFSVLSVTPTYPVTAKVDPDNAGVYYSTIYNETQKYRLPVGTEAYAATISGSDMILNKVADGGQVIPANTAVILRSTSASVVLTPTDAAAVTVSVPNLLQGTDSEKAAPANCYVLSGHSTDGDVTGVGFYQFSGTLAAHKAYITVSGSAPAPKRLRFVFNGENAATGIGNASETLKSEKRIENGQLVIIKNGVRYNAQGQIVK